MAMIVGKIQISSSPFDFNRPIPLNASSGRPMIVTACTASWFDTALELPVPVPEVARFSREEACFPLTSLARRPRLDSSINFTLCTFKLDAFDVLERESMRGGATIVVFSSPSMSKDESRTKLLGRSVLDW